MPSTSSSKINSSHKNIPFIDLGSQKNRIKKEVMDAVERVIDHGAYINGPEVAQLEEQLSQFCGAKYAVTCSSGTDALILALLAKGVKRRSAVFIPAYTFAATAEAVALLGATPVFVDVCPDTFNIDPNSLCQAIDRIRNTELQPVGVIAVDLFGLPADYVSLRKIAEAHNLWLIDDAAQSFGAQHSLGRIGQLADLTCTSFFPAKPLGCYGEGGAVFTDNPKTYEVLLSCRVHGQGKYQYDYDRIGLNARLATIQAAILLEKLKIFPDEIEKREIVARRYTEGLRDIIETPVSIPGCTSTWAQYTCKVENRSQVIKELKQVGVPTGIYYPTPLNEHPPYRHFPVAPNGLKVSKTLSEKVLSLPMHAYLDASTQDYIIEEVRKAVQSNS